MSPKFAGFARIFIAVLALMVVLAVTLQIIGLDVGFGLATLVRGSLGDKFAIARTLVRAIPLCLCGLGVVIAWKAGMYNIGGEGQYIIGAIAAGFFAQSGLIASPLLLTAGLIGGGFVGALAGWLHVHRGVQVVISTILLNFIAVRILEFCIRGPLQEPKHQQPMSAALPKSAMLPRFDAQTDLHFGIWIAVLAVAVIAVYIHFTHAGLRLRIVGDSPEAARANKIPVGRTQILAMTVSGSLCGLAGAVDFAGLTGRLADGFNQGWGFLAIPVALLGGLTAIGTMISALFFGGLLAGAEVLNRLTPFGASLVPALQGVAVLAYLGCSKLGRRARGARE